MKLTILNLSRITTDAEVLALFSPFGKVASCNLVMDKASGMSKGFGFVEMPDVAEANAAIAGLNGTKVQKNKIRVKQVAEKAE